MSRAQTTARVQVIHSSGVLRSALVALLERERFQVTGASGFSRASSGTTGAPGTPGAPATVTVVDGSCPVGAAHLERRSLQGSAKEPTHATPALAAARPGLGLAGAGAERAGIGLAGASRGRAALVVVLAGAEHPGVLRLAYAAGALGLVDRDGPANHLATAIRLAAGGGRYVDDGLAMSLLRAMDMPLSPREVRVLSRAAQGDSVAEIARGLCLSHGTVRNYIASATRKVGARNRVDAIRISRAAGWV
ncbi:helix-turn-helix transcriptional regulator [Streptomyces sp. NRRL B-3253]|uniref:helix-turn-helix transcriptional regulator n=1 Tax=Streptomyces sp. NRRL B-3253 TaxID=1463837 RepID=UPI0004CD3E39|nr:response regulator transcription factor [Streptomyces sp. NRRL B-3253]